MVTHSPATARGLKILVSVALDLCYSLLGRSLVPVRQTRPQAYETRSPILVWGYIYLLDFRQFPKSRHLVAHWFQVFQLSTIGVPLALLPCDSGQIQC